MYTLYARVVTQTHLSLSSLTQPCEERCYHPNRDWRGLQ
jgi:hypothetical protein